jgi:hypothetical protein
MENCPARSWRDYRSCSDEETMVASGVKRYPMMRWVSVLISTVTLLAAALRYVSLNPVRARLVARAQDWRWSSTRAHLTGKDDGITARAPIHQRFPHFADLLALEPDVSMFARLRAAESIGRPLGDDRFLARIERLTSRGLKPRKPGPKPGVQVEAKGN